MLRLRVALTLLLVYVLTACGKNPTDNTDLRSLPADAQLIDANEALEGEPTPPPESPLYTEYTVSLEVEPETRIVRGIERIRYTNQTGKPLDRVIIRLYLNTFSSECYYQPYFSEFHDEIYQHGLDYGYMHILYVSLDNDEIRYTLSADDTILTLWLNEPLAEGATTQFKIQFEAYVPKIAHRTGANDNALWGGAFLPVVSVYDDKGWHTEPYYSAGNPYYADTAIYTVEITTPEGYVVAGTGVKTETVMEDYTVTKLTAKMTRDFSFAISKTYQVASRTTPSGVDVYLYYYTENLPTEAILDMAVECLEYYQGAVGAYPYSLVGIAETDMFIEATEFSNIVFVDTATLQNTQNLSAIAHVLGHQWFYNVIGSNRITDAWLDEALNLFLQDRMRYPDPAALRAALETDYISMRSRYRFIRAGGGREIASSLSVYASWSDFIQIQYIKAKIMVYDLYNKMGDALFGQFVKEIYRLYSFKNINRADFIELAETLYGEDLSTFFDTWLYGTLLPEFPA